jgi:endoglucanase
MINVACSGGSSSPQIGGGGATGGTGHAGGASSSAGVLGSGVGGTTGFAGAGGAGAAGSAGQFGASGAASAGASGAAGTGGTSGAAATGGTSGAAGTGGGGAAGTGGAGGLAGSGGLSGGLTPQQAITLMAPGWNLGNSFDAIPNETSWGNPTPSQALITAVHTAGFKTLRLPVTWTDHIGPGPSYTIDAAWMNKVKQTAQWAIDAGMYVFVNTHHEADGGDGGWVTFPQSTADAMNVAKEVTAVWTQIATVFKSFDSRLMYECFNEPNGAGSGNTPQAQTDLNLYLEACVHAIRGTGGANATRLVMIQPIGASPILAGIQAMQKASIIGDPNLVISLHTYYPTNFGLSTTPYAWGSASDYTNMQNSIAKEIRVWLPTQAVFIGEWGSMGAQTTTIRAAHALAYSQDTTTGGLVPIWWDNGGSGSGSFVLFDRTSGTQPFPTIVSGIMTGVSNGLKAPNSWASP